MGLQPAGSSIGLWTKAWVESRARFLLAVALLCLLSLAFVVRTRTSFPPPEFPALPFSAFVWGETIGNMRPMLFALIALVLGLGGLQRERTSKTASFTLVLPVTRTQIVRARALTGAAQVVVLALVPALLIPSLLPSIGHQSYPFTQAMGFAVLYLGWGLVFFAIGFLWSTLFSGTYTAVGACIVTPFAALVAHERLFDHRGIEFPTGNFASFMSGIPYVDPIYRGTMLLVGPVPWVPLLTLAASAVMIVGVATAFVHRQDF